MQLFSEYSQRLENSQQLKDVWQCSKKTPLILLQTLIQNVDKRKNFRKIFCNILKGVMYPSWNHSFSTYAKFSEKLTRVRIGGKKCYFFGNCGAGTKWMIPLQTFITYIRHFKVSYGPNCSSSRNVLESLSEELFKIYLIFKIYLRYISY